MAEERYGPIGNRYLRLSDTQIDYHPAMNLHMTFPSDRFWPVKKVQNINVLLNWWTKLCLPCWYTSTTGWQLLSWHLSETGQVPLSTKKYSTPRHHWCRRHLQDCRERKSTFKHCCVRRSCQAPVCETRYLEYLFVRDGTVVWTFRHCCVLEGTCKHRQQSTPVHAWLVTSKQSITWCKAEKKYGATASRTPVLHAAAPSAINVKFK